MWVGPASLAGAVMRNEIHRLLCVEAFSAYLDGRLHTQSFLLSSLVDRELLPVSDSPRLVYILRLGNNASKSPELASIPNPLDPRQILYIGGHESGRATARYNSLIRACRQAERIYSAKGYAENDQSFEHKVGQCLTTGILQSGFKIADCVIDLASGGTNYDELEFLIGYQERFHHLPPWNTLRGGASAAYRPS